MLDFIGERSLGFYTLLTFLFLLIFQSIIIGVLFFFKSSGVKRSNHFYGLFLIAFGATLCHNVLIITDFFEHYPQFKYLPIYFTLSLPILLFFYVKLNLYPDYLLRFSDIKHFFLPIGQIIYFTALFFSPEAFKTQIDRSFYNPFYGAFEQSIYIVSFFAYFYFSLKYIEQRKKKNLDIPMQKKITYLYSLIQILALLFIIHTTFILVDFFSYEFLGTNLRTIKTFSGLGIMSFAVLVLWSGLYGFQILIWGRKLFSR